MHELPSFCGGGVGGTTGDGSLSVWGQFKRAAAPQPEHLQRQQRRGQELVFVPGRRPPSRADTEAWLAARRRRKRRREARRQQQQQHHHQQASAGAGASFGMDPNTVKLLPAAGGGGAPAAAVGGGTPGSVEGGEGDLLASPSLCTLGSGGSTPATAATTAGTVSQEDEEGGGSGASSSSSSEEDSSGGGEREVRVRLSPRRLCGWLCGCANVWRGGEGGQHVCVCVTD